MVDPDLWEARVLSDPLLAERPLVVDWARRGWPVMARRRLPGEQDVIPVAVPLPRSFTPHRIALSVPPAALLGRSRPPKLVDVGSPPAWRIAYKRLLTCGRVLSLEPRVFGSLMWQHVTGMTYLAATSDLDLIWTVGTGDVADDLCQAIAEVEAVTGVRIDGELIDREGTAVQWREYATGAEEVMVKSMQGVAVCRRERCFAGAPERVS